MTTHFEAIMMDKFMINKRCPTCDCDAFVIEQEGGQTFRIWYCGRCKRPLLKELISIEKKDYIKKLFERYYKK